MLPWAKLVEAQVEYCPSRPMLGYMFDGKPLYLPKYWESYESIYGEGTSQPVPYYQSRLDDLGLGVHWIGYSELPPSQIKPLKISCVYFAYALQTTAYQKQLQMPTPDRIALQLQTYKEYMRRELPFTNRQATYKDIVELLDKGFVVVPVEGGELFSTPAQVGVANPHAVLVVGIGTAPHPETGRSMSGIIFHNADGLS